MYPVIMTKVMPTAMMAMKLVSLASWARFWALQNLFRVFKHQFAFAGGVGGKDPLPFAVGAALHLGHTHAASEKREQRP
jgi:hypothetical protein